MAGGESDLKYMCVFFMSSLHTSHQHSPHWVSVSASLAVSPGVRMLPSMGKIGRSQQKTSELNHTQCRKTADENRWWGSCREARIPEVLTSGGDSQAPLTIYVTDHQLCCW